MSSFKLHELDKYQLPVCSDLHLCPLFTLRFGAFCSVAQCSVAHCLYFVYCYSRLAFLWGVQYQARQGVFLWIYNICTIFQVLYHLSARDNYPQDPRHVHREHGTKNTVQANVWVFSARMNNNPSITEKCCSTCSTTH